MSTDYYLYSRRTDSSVYIGYSWGAGMNERVDAEDRKLVADWIADHIGEEVIILSEPMGTVRERPETKRGEG